MGQGAQRHARRVRREPPRRLTRRRMRRAHVRQDTLGERTRAFHATLASTKAQVDWVLAQIVLLANSKLTLDRARALFVPEASSHLP